MSDPTRVVNLTKMESFYPCIIGEDSFSAHINGGLTATLVTLLVQPGRPWAFDYIVYPKVYCHNYDGDRSVPDHLWPPGQGMEDLKDVSDWILDIVFDDRYFSHFAASLIGRARGEKRMAIDMIKMGEPPWDEMHKRERNDWRDRLYYKMYEQINADQWNLNRRRSTDYNEWWNAPLIEIKNKE